eukprot:1094058-Prymnesium_polylepis.1
MAPLSTVDHRWTSPVRVKPVQRISLPLPILGWLARAWSLVSAHGGFKRQHPIVRRSPVRIPFEA